MDSFDVLLGYFLLGAFFLCLLILLSPLIAFVLLIFPIIYFFDDGLATEINTILLPFIPEPMIPLTMPLVSFVALVILIKVGRWSQKDVEKWEKIFDRLKQKYL